MVLFYNMKIRCEMKFSSYVGRDIVSVGIHIWPGQSITNIIKFIHETGSKAL